MAPPIAIMVSCRWPRRRCRPSPSGVGSCSPASAIPLVVLCGSVMAAHTGGFHDEQIDVLLENFRDGLYVVHGVVHMERDAQAILAVRSDDTAFSKLLHQQI